MFTFTLAAARFMAPVATPALRLFWARSGVLGGRAPSRPAPDGQRAQTEPASRQRPAGTALRAASREARAQRGTVDPAMRLGFPRCGRALAARVARSGLTRGQSGDPAMRLGFHSRDAGWDSLILLVELGVADQILLTQHIGDVLEMLPGQRRKVRVMAPQTHLAHQ